MPSPYIKKHWDVFSGIPHQSAGKIGFKPAAWAIRRGLADIPSGLPEEKLSRTEVREICRDTRHSVLYGYLCAMAWGGQGAGVSVNSVTFVWDNRRLLSEHLEKLRNGGLSRSQAYSLFLGEGSIPYLGPAYWTKLLYFFSPESDFYIMDQWTGKSINLLTGFKLVHLAGNAIRSDSKFGNYQAYCEEVDAMAAILNVEGADLEEMLMSKGGRNPWPWRAHLKHHYDYNPSLLHEVYPHISAGDF